LAERLRLALRFFFVAFFERSFARVVAPAGFPSHSPNASFAQPPPEPYAP